MVESLAAMLIESRAVEFGDFTLASGKKSSYYVDVKSACTQPALLSRIAAQIAGEFQFDVVAGVAVGGVPLAVAVSLASSKPYAIIRSSGKDHGKKGLIIGDVTGKNVLLVEDVTTSGGSAMYGVEALREAGARIRTVVTVVDREEGASSKLLEQTVDLVALARVSEILALRSR